MKRIIILLLGLGLVQMFKAQDTTETKRCRNEINIGYFNVFNLNSFDNVGIGYKLAIGPGAFRIGSSFIFNSSYRKYDTTSTSTSKSLIILPRIGYEFRKDYRKIQVFYGMDLTGSINNQEQTNFDISTNTTTYKSMTVGYGIGISPFIGVKYFINKHFSISTETSFGFMYSSSTRKISNNGSNPYETDYTSNNIYAKLSPLGVFSLNYHF